MAKVIV